MPTSIDVMDIKNVFKISTVGFLAAKKADSSRLKTDSTTDRDANGKQEQHSQPKRPMTEEEFALALEKLKKLSPFLEHKWSVEVLSQPPAASALIRIKDNLGQELRLVHEEELWSLLESPTPHKGQILKKSA